MKIIDLLTPCYRREDMRKLEKRLEETKKLPIRETRTLEDGATLTLAIYSLDATGLRGMEKGQIVVEKVLRVELPVRDRSPLSRTSSAQRSWDVPEETYQKDFREPKNFEDAVKCIERINGKGYGWNRRTL